MYKKYCALLGRSHVSDFEPHTSSLTFNVVKMCDNSHRIFSIRELLQLIFEGLLPPLDVQALTFASPDTFVDFVTDKPTRQTLINLALTCHKFLEPALDALWWAMDDLSPLFHLLPSYGGTRDDFLG